MPVLSQYWFDDTDFRGNTSFLSIGHPTGAWAWINSTNTGGRDSTLVWERRDDEIVVPLVPAVNNPSVTNAIDAILSGATKRTSALRCGWTPWKHVPYHDSNPGAHGDLSLLVRLSFDFHVSTPWYCSDADGYVSYYLFSWLDAAGHLRVTVDGWAYHFDGGTPFCSGAITDGLNTALPSGVGTVQAKLNEMIALFGQQKFSMLYLLPGKGERFGGGNTNVNDAAALVLLP